MKTYRTCLADAYAMEDVLQYLCVRLDEFEDEISRNKELYKEEKDEWRKEQINECSAKAAAFERIIVRLTK